jgi:signal peptidase II
MFFRTYYRIAALIVLGMALLLVDFVSKAYVYHVLPVCSSSSVGCIDLPVFYDFLGVDFLISLAVNRGAAWGFFADFQYVLLALRILVIFGLFVYLFFFNCRPFTTLPLLFIIAGALGNVVDFFLYGFVVDFFHFNLWGYHFPIFNFADAYITIGVFGLLLIGLFDHKRSSPQSYA